MSGFLAAVFPVLRRVPEIAHGSLPDDLAPDPIERRRYAMALVRELFATIRRQRPVVLAIDDVQWGDDESQRLFAELTREPDPPPLLFVLTEAIEALPDPEPVS